jgi:ATPase, YjeE family
MITFVIMVEIKINGIGDLPRAAKVFLEKKGEASIIAFYGNMGAGKTTFITALCRELGVQDVVNSPTFTIVNEYRSAVGEPVYHFDFYRINRLTEAIDIGLYEYFDSGDLCLIEWPEMIEELLPEETLKVQILVEDEDTRSILF